MHDTVELEKRGIPATTMITEAFKKAAEFQFQVKGMPGHAYVQLPHPVSNLQPDAMRQVTLRFVDEVAGRVRCALAVPAVLYPERFQLVVAGGTPGPISAVMHGWNPASRSVSRAYAV